MRRYLLSLLILATGLALSCRRVYPPEPGPGGAVCPQVHIPWPSLADSPWPMFQHDPQCTGRSPLRGPRKGKIKWTFKPGGTIYLSVVIGPDSSIYVPFTDWNRNQTGLCALDPTGDLKWKLYIPLGSEAVAPIVLADGTVLVAGFRDTLYAIDAKGRVRERFPFDFQLSPMLSVGLDGTIYLARRSHLYAVNQQGHVLWEFTAPHGFGAQMVAISADGSTLYVFDYLSYPRIAALIAVGTNGELKWTFPIQGDQNATASPVVDSHGNIYFGTFGTSDSCGFYKIDQQGRLVWKHGSPAVPEPCITPLGRLFFVIPTTHPSTLTSLDCEGNVRWQRPSDVGMSPFVTDNEGVVYGCSQKGVVALAPDGEVLWEIPFEARATRVGSPAIGYDGVLYVGTFSSPLDESGLYAIE